ncbi:MAG: DUF362 domain-containing protein, partial [Syntrophobacteraceae bacterium]|nr:DUF362 domain-containing protein [Syntrophobacteraceae bacterium]
MRFLVKDNRAKFFAFVIMENHIHLIWQMLPDSNPEAVQRDFLKYTGVAGGALILGMDGGIAMSKTASRVALVKTDNRKNGVKTSLKVLNINPVKGKNVLVKPNFNTADTPPGSTHNDTLIALVEEIWAMGAKSVSLGERSYPPTREVMEKKGILPILDKLNVTVIDFDDLEVKDWVLFKPRKSHWPNGFRIARPILDTECLISTGCLKTHQYGGIFTLSLKLHVGVVPTSRHGYDYMKELHGSPHQRKMIAEINEPFKPALVILDGIDAFVDGGPMTGKHAKGEVFLASQDRVAMDAVGVAILKFLGSNESIMKPKIFDQEQIARAAELGIGASSASEIELVPDDEKSRAVRRSCSAPLPEPRFGSRLHIVPPVDNRPDWVAALSRHGDLVWEGARASVVEKLLPTGSV